MSYIAIDQRSFNLVADLLVPRSHQMSSESLFGGRESSGLFGWAPVFEFVGFRFSLEGFRTLPLDAEVGVLEV